MAQRCPKCNLSGRTDFWICPKCKFEACDSCWHHGSRCPGCGQMVTPKKEKR